jgi:cation transport regulator
MPPYAAVDKLPQNIKDELPKEAQERYLVAFNEAFEEERTIEGKKDKETAHEKAWESIKREFPELELK